MGTVAQLAVAAAAFTGLASAAVDIAAAYRSARSSAIGARRAALELVVLRGTACAIVVVGLAITLADGSSGPQTQVRDGLFEPVPEYFLELPDEEALLGRGIAVGGTVLLAVQAAIRPIGPSAVSALAWALGVAVPLGASLITVL